VEGVLDELDGEEVGRRKRIASSEGTPQNLPTNPETGADGSMGRTMQITPGLYFLP
jgi:hypothetical protein